MATPVTPSATLTPAAELKAIVLPASIVPMLMPDDDGSTATPLKKLGIGRSPVASVPMKLFWIDAVAVPEM